MMTQKLYLNEHLSKLQDYICVWQEVDECPVCHAFHGIPPLVSYLRLNDKIPEKKQYLIFSFYICHKCFHSFISEHMSLKELNHSEYCHFKFIRVAPIEIIEREFEEEISELSPKGVSIYNEAFKAEQHGLLDICGMGYRKSLEFIIKDYLIKLYPQNEEKIKSEALGSCINNNQYNVSENIKEIAKRCAWLGNDHCHYQIKHEDKDLKDLKTLLDITIHWIIMSIQTERAIAEIQHR